MISARCPICKKEIRAASLGDLPSFPFCSDRCRLIDLGRWIDGGYAITGPEGEVKPQMDTEEHGSDSD